MPISDFEGDWTVYRDQYYSVLRASFISDDGDSTFPTDDASTEDAPDVSVFQSILWAIATGFGQAEEQFRRAQYNQAPGLADELLALHERDYQVIPPFDATIPDRQNELRLRSRVADGASTQAIEAALTERFGADFVSYDTLDSVAAGQRWPANPGDYGVFDVPTAERKIFRILKPVNILGRAITVPYELLGNSNPPIAGEHYCFDPDPRRRTERVEIVGTSQVDGVRYLTAIFGRAHDNQTVACRPHPVGLSTQRHSRVVLTHAAATDATTRHRVHDFLRRTLGGSSTWSVVSDAGAFTLGDATKGLLGITPFSAPASAPAPTLVYAAGSANAKSKAEAVGATLLTGGGVGNAAAISTATAVGAATKTAPGQAAATSDGVAQANAQKRAAGTAAATSTARAEGKQGPIGSAAATSTAVGVSATASAGVGAAAATSTATGVSAAQKRSSGSANATSTATGRI